MFPDADYHNITVETVMYVIYIQARADRYKCQLLGYRRVISTPVTNLLLLDRYEKEAETRGRLGISRFLSLGIKPTCR